MLRFVIGATTNFTLVPQLSDGTDENLATAISGVMTIKDSVGGSVYVCQDLALTVVGNTLTGALTIPEIDGISSIQEGQYVADGRIIWPGDVMTAIDRFYVEIVQALG